MGRDAQIQPSAQVKGIKFQRQDGLDRRGGVSYLAEDGTRLRSITAVEAYLIRSGLKDELPGCLALFSFSSVAADGEEQLSSRSTPCKQEEVSQKIKRDIRPPARGKRARASPAPSSPPSTASPPPMAEESAGSAAKGCGRGSSAGAAAGGSSRISGREPDAPDATPKQGAADGEEVRMPPHRFAAAAAAAAAAWARQPSFRRF
jgi:hypothetical protein